MSNLLFALSTCLILCNFNVRLIVVFDAGFGFLQKKVFLKKLRVVKSNINKRSKENCLFLLKISN